MANPEFPSNVFVVWSKDEDCWVVLEGNNYKEYLPAKEIGWYTLKQIDRTRPTTKQPNGKTKTIHK